VSGLSAPATHDNVEPTGGDNPANEEALLPAAADAANIQAELAIGPDRTVALPMEGIPGGSSASDSEILLLETPPTAPARSTGQEKRRSEVVAYGDMEDGVLTVNPITTLMEIPPQRGNPIKMTRPASLALDLEDDTELQMEKVTQFKIECQDYFNHYKVPQEQWMVHAYHWMAGRLRRHYTQSYEKKGAHLTWTEFSNMLGEITQSTERPQHEWRKALEDFTMEKICTVPGGTPKSIVFGIGKLEDIMRHIPSLDEAGRCFALWKSLPTPMQDLLRHDQQTQEEFKEFKKLKKACIHQQLSFERHLNQNHVHDRAARKYKREFPFVNTISANPEHDRPEVKRRFTERDQRGSRVALSKDQMTGQMTGHMADPMTDKATSPMTNPGQTSQK
jgi:hypothetical protein